MEQAIRISSTTSKLITNEELLSYYLTCPMEIYFLKKLEQEDPSYIRIKICELLKYLSLGHFFHGDIPFNQELDELWHLWILQTAEYQELTYKLPGNKFIHHSSKDYVNSEKNKTFDESEKINSQVSFLVSYIENFGDLRPEVIKFWPMAINLMNVFNFDLCALNNYLISNIDNNICC